MEQTLNQLLACMDGLDTNNNGVTVIAATNRFEVLDTALTRPGRCIPHLFGYSHVPSISHIRAHGHKEPHQPVQKVYRYKYRK